jgi:hypothetical protein
VRRIAKGKENNMTEARDRGTLKAEIIQDVEQIVDEEIADSQFELTDQARQSVRDELVNYTQRILDALSSQEMQSESALVLHLYRTRVDAQRLIRERRSRN